MEQHHIWFFVPICQPESEGVSSYWGQKSLSIESCKMETMELSTPLHSSQKNLDSQTNISSEYKMREKSRIRKTRADKD